MNKKILDMCCGSRMFYFDKGNKDVLFGDIRELETKLCDGRKLSVKPDKIIDLRKLPFKDNSFDMVVFDPPHITRAGKKSFMALKYGVLNKDWKSDLKKGFEEGIRVLRKRGVMVFKWSEVSIKSKEVLELCPIQPLLGHTTGRQSKTKWFIIYKEEK